jgi:hypothetical protein
MALEASGRGGTTIGLKVVRGQPRCPRLKRSPAIPARPASADGSSLRRSGSGTASRPAPVRSCRGKARQGAGSARPTPPTPRDCTPGTRPRSRSCPGEGRRALVDDGFLHHRIIGAVAPDRRDAWDSGSVSVQIVRGALLAFGSGRHQGFPPVLLASILAA